MNNYTRNFAMGALVLSPYFLTSCANQHNSKKSQLGMMNSSGLYLLAHKKKEDVLSEIAIPLRKPGKIYLDPFHPENFHKLKKGASHLLAESLFDLADKQQYTDMSRENRHFENQFFNWDTQKIDDRIHSREFTFNKPINPVEKKFRKDIKGTKIESLLQLVDPKPRKVDVFGMPFKYNRDFGELEWKTKY